MHKNKLVEIFTSFTLQERNRLEQFILSPYHNQHTAVISLFNYLKVNLSADIDKHSAFGFMYPGEQYNDLKFRHISSYLQKLIEEFLVVREAESDKETASIYLLKAYRSRNLSKQFESELAKTARAFDSATLRDLNYHYQHYQLLNEKYNHTGARNIEVEPLLQDINDGLDIYYTINKLKQACNMLSHQRLFKSSYRFTMIDAIVRHIREQKLDQLPEVAIYYNTYMMLSTDGDLYFRELKNQIATHYSTFRQEEMRDIYLLAINYCITKLNKGESGFTREVFEIYKEGIKNAVLYENGMLSPFTYKNIVAAGLKLEEISWTEKFIRQCKDHVPRSHRESFFIYNMAKLGFVKKEYKQVMRALNNVEIDDLFTNIDAKVTLIKTYVEAREYERLDYLLENLGQVLRRKKVMDYHRTNYFNFISIVKKLVNLKTFDKQKKAKLRNEITRAEILTEREWLLEKVNEF